MTKTLTITQFFDSLDAPLKNPQWSWGAVRSDGVVFLRVWDIDVFTDDDGKQYAVLLSPGHHTSRHGAPERLQQLALVRAGAPCYIVVITAVDNTASPRKIDHFDRHKLLVGGRIVERGDLTLIEIIGQTTPMTVRVKKERS